MEPNLFIDSYMILSPTRRYLHLLLDSLSVSVRHGSNDQRIKMIWCRVWPAVWPRCRPLLSFIWGRRRRRVQLVPHTEGSLPLDVFIIENITCPSCTKLAQKNFCGHLTKHMPNFYIFLCYHCYQFTHTGTLRKILNKIFNIV